MNKKFTRSETIAYGLGAIGKDIIYALSATYVMYYYQDLLGLSASFVGFILLAARIFDAANDPFMGIIVARTKSRWGRFRPWILSGTILNAFVIYALFSAGNIQGKGLMVYFSVLYILWGMTYTMMDIPFWSMIPAVTEEIKDREKLSVVGRTCAGIGNALITVFTVIAVKMLGSGNERLGFSRLALVCAILFILTEAFLFVTIKDRSIHQTDETEPAAVRDMFRTLFANDQAMTTVLTIVLINGALYITSNLIIYFFKYDISGAGWQNSYTLFTMCGGIGQILGMMILYPLLRKFLSNTGIFRACLISAIAGYLGILIMCFTGLAHNMILLCLAGLLVFAANGILTVLTTVFLSNTVDYGEWLHHRRDESVIFSMQTFVVKAASGFAVFLTGIGIDLIGLAGNPSQTDIPASQSASTIAGLRLLMTVLPIIGLIAAYRIFITRFKLTDEKAEEISAALKQRHAKE